MDTLGALCVGADRTIAQEAPGTAESGIFSLQGAPSSQTRGRRENRQRCMMFVAMCL